MCKRVKFLKDLIFEKDNFLFLGVYYVLRGINKSLRNCYIIILFRRIELI